MSVNLINEKDLNAYLTDIIYRGQKMETFTAGNFQSEGFVRAHKDAIIRSMLTQWMKTRMRAYLSSNEKVPYLKPVSYSETLPAWAKNCLAEGKSIFTFSAKNFPAQLQNKIIQTSDFLYNVAENYVNKVLAQAKNKGTPPKLRIDCLKTNNEYDSFEKAFNAAQKWHEVMAYKAGKQKKDDILRRKAEKGTVFYKQITEDMSIFQLKTPAALDFESEYMGHCVGKGGYDADVKRGKIKIFSLRDAQGLPHATLEVRDNTVRQCKGKADRAPNAKYMPYLQMFLKMEKLKVDTDFKNLGLLEQHGKYYNIWNLPDDFIVEGDFDISDMGLTQLPDLSKVSVEGHFICSSNRLKQLTGSPKYVGGNFICYDNQLENLEGSPETVMGNFVFDDNPIVSLTGAPLYVAGDFRCAGMGLTSLKGCPKKIGCSFLCQNNLLTSLAGAPVEVGLDFVCDNNLLTDLYGAPEKVGRNFFCNKNKLTTLMGAPRHIGDSMFCGANLLTEDSAAPEYIRFNYRYIIDLPENVSLEKMLQNGKKITLAKFISKEREN